MNKFSYTFRSICRSFHGRLSVFDQSLMHQDDEGRDIMRLDTDYTVLFKNGDKIVVFSKRNLGLFTIVSCSNDNLDSYFSTWLVIEKR